MKFSPYVFANRNREVPPNIKRFAITKPSEPTEGLPDMRVLAFANQGRNHYDTREAAEEALRVLQSNNPEWRLREFNLDKARVDEIECYHHGDAVGIYVLEDRENG